MLSAYPKDRAKGSALASHSWIDFLDPTDAERAAFETAFGLRVPSNEALGEIEATSRLQVENGALYMTAPLIFASGNEPWLPSPAGFVLSKQVLMTLRFAQSATFDAVAKECGAQEKLEPAAAFVNFSKRWSTIWRIFWKPPAATSTTPPTLSSARTMP